MTIPASLLVAALNSLQNAMMLTPCWPRAGPTGGAGLACPAGICNLIWPTTFFAMVCYLLNRRAGGASCRWTAWAAGWRFFTSGFLDFPIFQFHRRVAAKHVDRHLQLAFIRVDFLNHAAEVEERAIVDLDRLAD